MPMLLPGALRYRSNRDAASVTPSGLDGGRGRGLPAQEPSGHLAARNWRPSPLAPPPDEPVLNPGVEGQLRAESGPPPPRRPRVPPTPSHSASALSSCGRKAAGCVFAGAEGVGRGESSLSALAAAVGAGSQVGRRLWMLRGFRP